MRRKHFYRLILAFLLIGIVVPAARAESASTAPLQVMILDENGSLVRNAHIYIFSSNKKKFMGTREAHGSATFDLPVGDYRVYAARLLQINGVIDHYTSPEARVRVTAEEPTSVILSLQKAEDSEMAVSDSAREKMGIDENLAKYLN